MLKKSMYSSFFMSIEALDSIVSFKKKRAIQKLSDKKKIRKFSLLMYNFIYFQKSVTFHNTGWVNPCRIIQGIQPGSLTSEFAVYYMYSISCTQ